ncbi:endolysin [Sphingobium sp. Z007]|uniref:endolysin n=1 Tax=Sphingobium sp. Z007 TaxID=627495 RepID=UPI000B49E16D|nr:endolysin [Sphingobium sp. Z007]
MTYSLGAKSNAALVGVHPIIVSVVRAAISITEQDFTVFEGVRSLATQKEYMKRGVTRTLASKHLRQPDGKGHAVDLVPWIAGQPRWEWEPIYRIAVAMDKAATAQGVAHRIRWGGIWDRTMAQYGTDAPQSMKEAVAAYCKRHPGPDFIDGPHYELVP